MRIIFFAGKGGVGKSSVAAATGVRAAEMGKRTLVMSLDVAHGLADIFDLDQGLLDRNRGRPFKINDNLWIQEMDIQEEISRNWSQIHDYLSGLLNTSGLDEMLAEEYFKAIEDMCERLKGVDQILCDPDVTTVRLVANPEKVVLKETQRAFMYFCLYRMCIDAVIMNRILPSQVTDAYFEDWRQDQASNLRRAEEFFNPVPILPVNLCGSEIVGYESLRTLSARIYGPTDPLERLVAEEPYRLFKQDGRYCLQLKLPFVVKEHIDLHMISDELILRIGSYKRHILLPKQVASRTAVKAKIEDPYLNITFSGGTHG